MWRVATRYILLLSVMLRWRGGEVEKLYCMRRDFPRKRGGGEKASRVLQDASTLRQREEIIGHRSYLERLPRQTRFTDS